MKRIIAAFDFDGTLTKKDTLLEFIRFARGPVHFYIGFALYSPILILMKVGLYPNWKAKEKVFSFFFKGMEYKKFQLLGQHFADIIETFCRKEIIDKLKEHVNHGDSVYIISASIDDWVRPWCDALCVTDVLGTKIEVSSDGIITGKFLTKNCYGQEKVERLMEKEPLRNDYILYAYGDSRGDKEMLEFADTGIYV